MLPSFFDPIGMSALRMFLNGWKFSLSLVAFSLMFAGPAATAGELIMYEQDGCYNCDLWKKEVGKIYPLTDEARILPLRMVDIHGPQPKDLEFLGPIRFTPYFAIIENGQKVGHIFGYNNEDAFYGMLGEIIEKLKTGSKQKAGKKSAVADKTAGEG